MPLSPSDIATARNRIAPLIRRTPLHQSLSIAHRLKCGAVHLKMECWQKTGSFKERGALNKMLSLNPEEKARGVVAASAGNHGLGVCVAAGFLGVNATIVVPETAVPTKVEALRLHRAEIVLHGRTYDEAEQYAHELQHKSGAVFVHAFDDPVVIAGQGTIGLEIMEDLPDADTIFVPVGGGGLISGLGFAVKNQNPGVRIIGIQSEASPAMHDSYHAGRIQTAPVAATLADGLAGERVSQHTLDLSRKYCDDMLLVKESTIAEAIRLLVAQERFLVEGSAAVSLAALMDHPHVAGQKNVLILTGRNITYEALKQILT